MIEGEDKLRSSRLHINNRTPLLHSTLAELEEKTKSMVKLIEQDADSFSQRAEIYYNKRPKLINMVQDFHRMHTSLAESYDQVIKFAGVRKSLSLQEKDSHGCKLVEVDESEVVDPPVESSGEEWRRLRGELERLREENRVQREELMHKDEEKRDVIRQLTLAMSLLMEENLELDKCL